MIGFFENFDNFEKFENFENFDIFGIALFLFNLVNFQQINYEFL